MKIPWAERRASWLSAFLGLFAPLWLLMAPIGVLIAIVTLPARPFRKRAAMTEPKFDAVTWPRREGDSRGIAVCIHGWPDMPHMWQSLGERLTHCGYAVLSLQLPGFDGTPVGKGWDYPQMLDALEARIAELGEPVTFFVHDFGCLYGMMLAERRPDLVRGMLALDVGRSMEVSRPEMFAIASYQSYLAFAFVLGGAAGAFMARTFAAASAYRERPLSEIHAHMGYPYRYLVRAAVRGTLDSMFGPMRSEVPVFYAYGKRKMMMFHGRAFIEQLENDPRSEVLALDCGHWILGAKPDELWQHLEPWLAQRAADA